MPAREEPAHAARAGSPAVRLGRPALAPGGYRLDLHLEAPPPGPRRSAAPPTLNAKKAARDSETPPGSCRLRQAAPEGIFQDCRYEREKALVRQFTVQLGLVKFSIITVNYRSWPYTLRCVDSLYKTGYEDFEVVVVDNDQESVVPEIPHPVRLIRNPENVGFARACNQGTVASSGEHVVFVNPDTLVEDGFFEGLERFFDENPRAGVVSPGIVGADG